MPLQYREICRRQERIEAHAPSVLVEHIFFTINGLRSVPHVFAATLNHGGCKGLGNKVERRKAKKMGEKSELNVRKRLTAEDMARQQREISISEFFTKNRHLLGFDNPKRALLTTVKEAVDNSLDACEEAGILPEVVVEIKPTSIPNRFRVRVEDNGPGIVRQQVGRIFGKLLYGSKFHRLKMSRGQQGIGISAAGMYGQLTSGQPVVVISQTKPKGPAYYYELMLDTKTNEPRILKQEQITWNGHTGTSVEIELEGFYQRGRWSPDEYLEQTAMVNPHVTLRYQDPEGCKYCFERVSEVLPVEPRAIKPHPYGIELGTLIHMMNQTKARHVKSFLRTDFSRVSDKNAEEICQKAGIAPESSPKRIARQQAEALLKAIRETKLRKPPMDCISPIGEEQLLAGMRKHIKADLYECVTRSPSIYRGIPFVVEAAVAFGGELPPDKPARLMRFANRVPLLFQAGGCVITQTAQAMNWRQYALDQPTGSLPVGPLVILVHVASPWVPFTSESKEAIASYPEIEREVELALQECARRLRVFVNKRRRWAEEARKRQYIEKYIPHIGEALQSILKLQDKEKQHIIRRLTETLERSRGG
jgi:DNA topoisomerase-6 subunit B